MDSFFRPVWTVCMRACVHVYTWVRIRIFMHHMTERESYEFSMCHIPAQGNTFLQHVNAKKYHGVSSPNMSQIPSQ